MEFKLRLIPAAIAAMMLAACGGSGSGSPTDVSTGGVAVDGYLVGSKVTCDKNSDWKAVDDETNVLTVADGKFTFVQRCEYGLILSGGTSSDTLLPFVGIIKAPAYSRVLSPLTTLIADGATPAQVIAALALASDTDLLATDPVAVAGDTPDLLIKTLAVQHLLQKVSEMLASLAYPSLDVVAVEAVNPIYDEVAKSFAIALQTGSPFIVTGTTPATFDISRVNAWIKAAAESASMPDAVKAAITGDGKLGAARLANAASKALATQANAYLAASDRDSVELVTKAQQASPAVANAIKAVVVGGVLGSASTDSAVSTLADEITNRLTDAVAPILTLRDDTAAVTATGPVTFYFDVNEDVGRIFKATDISVTNGTMGDIVKIDAKHYSMVVTPEANAVKTITVTVPAKTFTDMAGNMNDTEVKATQAYNTTTEVLQDTILAAFGGGVTDQFGPYGGSEVKIDVAPAGGDGDALKIVKPANAMVDGVVVTWGGAWYVLRDNAAIPFAANRKTITARVYSSKSPSEIELKVDDHNPLVVGSKATSEPKAVASFTGPANTWQTLTWVLNDVDVAKVYKTIAITPDANVTTSGQTYYIDDIKLLAASGNTVEAPELTITDAEAATITTSDVKFYFQFTKAIDLTSLDVATEIVVTKGTLSGFAEDTSKPYLYSATVKPTPNSSGTMTVTVAKNAFKDATGLFNTKEATRSQDFDTRVDPNSYLYVANNSMTLVDGSTSTPFTMAGFQLTGIDVKWPMSTAAKLTFNLAQTGTPFVSGTFNAAVSIAQELPAGTGLVKAYIKNVSVTKTGNSVVITVPDVADAKMYGVSATNTKTAVVDFSNTVNKVTNTLTTLAGTLSTVGFGNVVNYAINGVSNDFTGMSTLTGKYKVTIVVADLPLKQADGTVFPTATISVPTKTDNSTSVSVTGPSLVGFINLKP
jgi:hypothetical protein